MQFTYDDGGRAAAGFRGDTGDCVTRALAIAMQLPYQEVYDAMAEGNQGQRVTKKSLRSRGAARRLGARTAAHGITTGRKWFKDWMAARGWKWVPTMGIGTGCKVHLHDGELPLGRLIVAVSKHYTAVVDGVIHDTHDPQRETHWINTVNGVQSTGVSRRCVYGYWQKA